MRILLSNDDGYLAPGLAQLATSLADLGDIVVVAPERNRSGASNSLTLDLPLHMGRAANGYIYVSGTPTDCVHLAVTGVLEQQPDMVVSGINLGANMGDDTIYSGTVAAATEGYLLGVPAIAISLASFQGRNFATAGRVARELVQRFTRAPFVEPVLLNVNVPNRAYDELKPFKVCRLGRRHAAEKVISQLSPRGDMMYWIGSAGAAKDDAEGTDFHATTQGHISITPLKVDLTDHDHLGYWAQTAAKLSAA